MRLLFWILLPIAVINFTYDVARALRLTERLSWHLPYIGGVLPSSEFPATAWIRLENETDRPVLVERLAIDGLAEERSSQLREGGENASSLNWPAALSRWREAGVLTLRRPGEAAPRSFAFALDRRRPWVCTTLIVLTPENTMVQPCLGPDDGWAERIWRQR